jgi:hypothetical protein
MKDSSFGDITLVLGTQKRVCHKVILSRARTWRNLFMQDPKLSELTVSDLMSEKVGNLLLEYLYKDELPNPGKVSKEEEKALLLELKKLCDHLGVEKLGYNLAFKNSIGIESTSLFEEIPASMSQDFQLLLDSSSLCDVAFQLEDGTPVQAHKVDFFLFFLFFIEYFIVSKSPF